MDCEKRIAYIFEEAKIFLTKDVTTVMQRAVAVLNAAD